MSDTVLDEFDGEAIPVDRLKPARRARLRYAHEAGQRRRNPDLAQRLRNVGDRSSASVTLPKLTFLDGDQP